MDEICRGQRCDYQAAERRGTLAQLGPWDSRASKSGRMSMAGKQGLDCAQARCLGPPASSRHEANWRPGDELGIGHERSSIVTGGRQSKKVKRRCT